MRKIHRPCLVLALVFMTGIWAGRFLPLPLWLWLGLGAACLCAFFLQRRSPLIYVCLFCLGAVGIQQQYRLPPNSLAFLPYMQRVQVEAVEGTVDSDIQIPAEPDGRAVFDLNAGRIFLQGHWRAVCGKVRVQWDGDYLPGYGQVLRLKAKLQAPFDFPTNSGFSYRQYLREQGVYWTMRVKATVCEKISDGHPNMFMLWSLKVRHSMTAVFKRFLAPRESSFVSALVLGDRSGMPKDLKEIFIHSGTAHILAISGMNMAVIAALFFFILRLCGLPRWVQFCGTIIFLFAYAFLSGWSASVVRACIMSAVILAGFAFEEESDPLNSLGLAALILLALDPANLFDIGFQLSFGAVGGILTLYGHCERLFQFLPRFISAPMSVSLAAWLGTAVIAFYHFRTITPISILANIPIVPLADSVMLLGLGLAFGGACWAPLGYVFAGCLKVVLSTMVICASWFSQVPYGHM